MFTPEYKDWPAAHRRLLAVVIVTPVILALLTWLLAAPQWRLYRNALAACHSSEKKIRRLEWPADDALLQEQLDNCTAMLDGAADAPGLRSLAENAIKRATGTFLPQILATYPGSSREDSIQRFVNTASRIDYKFIANQIDQDLRQHDCHLPPAIMTIEDNATPVPTYQSIIHLWTLQKVISLALAQDLQIVCQADTGDAETSLLPIQSYRLQAKAQVPYLHEFPVRLILRGTMTSFLQFADSLQSPDCFLPLTRLSVVSRPPADVALGTDAVVEFQEFTIVCTSFFEPQKVEAPQEVPVSQP